METRHFIKTLCKKKLEILLKHSYRINDEFYSEWYYLYKMVQYKMVQKERPWIVLEVITETLLKHIFRNILHQRISRFRKYQDFVLLKEIKLWCEAFQSLFVCFSYSQTVYRSIQIVSLKIWENTIYIKWGSTWQPWCGSQEPSNIPIWNAKLTPYSKSKKLTLNNKTMTSC